MLNRCFFFSARVIAQGIRIVAFSSLFINVSANILTKFREIISVISQTYYPSSLSSFVSSTSNRNSDVAFGRKNIMIEEKPRTASCIPRFI
jgi:hypothetical protein